MLWCTKQGGYSGKYACVAHPLLIRCYFADGKSLSGGKSKGAGENNSTMNFELSEGESGLAALTESQFRQGLEASLDLPTTDNE